MTASSGFKCCERFHLPLGPVYFHTRASIANIPNIHSLGASAVGSLKDPFVIIPGCIVRYNFAEPSHRVFDHLCTFTGILCRNMTFHPMRNVDSNQLTIFFERHQVVLEGDDLAISAGE